MGFRGVFDHGHIISLGDYCELIHVRGMTIKVNREDRFGLSRYRTFYAAWIDRVVRRVDIDENRNGTTCNYRGYRRQGERRQGPRRDRNR